MSSQVQNRLPLLIALIGGFLVVKNFIVQEVENYADGLGFTIKGFRPKWKLFDPLNLYLEIDIDIRNDNHVGGQVLGADGFITWGDGGAKLSALSVTPFNLQANGHINKSTWIVKINLLSVPTAVKEQAQSGDWKQLPWIDADIKSSYGTIHIKEPMINLS